MKKENITLWLSIGAIAISIIALVRFWARTENIGIDYLGILIGILTLIVAIVAILFGYNMYGLQVKMKAYIDKRIQEQNKEIHDFNIDLETDIAKSLGEVYQIDANNAYNNKRYESYIFYLISSIYYRFKADDVNLEMSIKTGVFRLSKIDEDIKANNKKIKLPKTTLDVILPYLTEMKGKFEKFENIIYDIIEI